MTEFFHHLLLILVPLTVTNILHMVVVKKRFLNLLAIPVWDRAFGYTKTWRGMLFVPFVNAIFTYVFVYLAHYRVADAFMLGFILGIAYVVFELPNSFIKRRVGIPPGERHPKYGLLFSLADKTDSALGVALMYYFSSDINPLTACGLFLAGSLTHIMFSFLLVLIHLKSSF